MRLALLALLAAYAGRRPASAFLAWPSVHRLHAEGCAFRWRSSGLAALPTASDVSTDDFMKQLGHASQIIPLLHPEGGESISDEDSAAMLEVLSRQLGNSDGIRGFFAVYLTSPESLTAEEVPEVLAEAVRSADAKILVPLACMNVLMPTAMTSIHQDAELKECAAKTAANGTKILRLLKGNEDVVNNCRAILSVCHGADEGSAELREYWEKFFGNYNYEDEQRKDIALAVAEFC
ncbi:hypothetical protein ACHAXT_003538 [Thalassiosira profunda]